MKKHIALAALLFAVCGAFLCGTTQAQCSIDTSGYGSYDKEAVDSTGTHLLVTVEIDGTATMDATCGDPSSITHTPYIVTNYGSNQGDPVCANCYLTYQLTWDSGALSPGQEVEFDYSTSVICSAAGTLPLLNASKYFEFADTSDKATGAGTYNGTSLGDPAYKYNVVHNCSNGTPDFNPSVVEDINPHSATDRYFIVTGMLFRFSQTSTWRVLFPNDYVSTVNGGPGPLDPQPWCTHTGPQK